MIWDSTFRIKEKNEWNELNKMKCDWVVFYNNRLEIFIFEIAINILFILESF